MGAFRFVARRLPRALTYAFRMIVETVFFILIGGLIAIRDRRATGLVVGVASFVHPTCTYFCSVAVRGSVVSVKDYRAGCEERNVVSTCWGVHTIVMGAIGDGEWLIRDCRVRSCVRFIELLVNRIDSARLDGFRAASTYQVFSRVVASPYAVRVGVGIDAVVDASKGAMKDAGFRRIWPITFRNDFFQRGPYNACQQGSSPSVSQFRGTNNEAKWEYIRCVAVIVCVVNLYRCVRGYLQIILAFNVYFVRVMLRDYGRAVLVPILDVINVNPGVRVVSQESCAFAR